VIKLDRLGRSTRELLDDPLWDTTSSQGRLLSTLLAAIAEFERELIRELNVRVYTMSDIDRGGLERAMNDALAYLEGAPFVHVSIDLDVVDPMIAPGVGTPVPGGFSYREAHLVAELVAESGLLDSLELVEVNPVLDRANETGLLAVELAASALGARIL